jgi:uncharacterized protein DUF6599
MFRKYYLLNILYISFLGTCAMADLTEFLPAEINEWNKNEVQTYNTENLYEYINGGAELYISYGFENMMSCKYVRKNQPDIFVDIFDMGNSFNAFGIFAHFRETIDCTFGQGSQYTFGNLLFWKDQYFISILASPETEESKKAIKLIAQHIDNIIEETGTIPPIINSLPKENLIRESLRYFHHYIWLNSFYYIADKNILNINENTEAVLAKYQNEKQQSILLLVNYKNENDANDAIENFITLYLPELKTNSVQQVEDGSWVGYKKQGKIISILFNSPTEKWCKKVLGQNGK